MNVPTYVLFIVAPLNLLFNWLLVSVKPSQIVDQRRSGDPIRSAWALWAARWQLLSAIHSP
jgi:Na+-driven multidrug efflux pump